jgi:hypothetical protein
VRGAGYWVVGAILAAVSCAGGCDAGHATVAEGHLAPPTHAQPLPASTIAPPPAEPKPKPAWTPLRAIDPAAASQPIRTSPPTVSDTLLAFGEGGEGVEYLYDLGTHLGRHFNPPAWFSSRDYNRWETGPFFGDSIRAGDRIAYGVGPRNGAARSRTVSIPDTFGSPVRLLDRQEVGYLASLTSNSVWVLHRAPHHAISAQDLDPDTGEVLARTAPLGRYQRPDAQLDNGFLTEAYLGNGTYTALQVRDPLTGKRIETVTRDASSDIPVVAALGHTVAWQGGGQCTQCTLHLTNTLSRVTRVVHWHAPFRYECDQGSLSPNQRWLVVTYGCARRHYNGGVALLVNVATGRGRVITASHGVVEDTGVGWSADSKWVFWQGYGHHIEMLAYQPGAARPEAFPVNGEDVGFATTFP